MGISTHILDTTRGKPAVGVAVTLERLERDTWQRVGQGTTDADGRVKSLLPEGSQPEPGIHRIGFAVAGYFEGLGVEAFYPAVDIQFVVRAPEHHHVPLLLNPFGYGTYRGT